MSPKYSVDDGHWEMDDEPEHPEDQAIETSHHIRINDERDSIERYNGLQWWCIVEDGVVTAIDKSHYCPGPGHTDPMGFRGWSDVPGPVQKAILNELNASGAEDVIDIEATEDVAEDNWP